MSQKDLLVDLPWFQFLSSVQVYAKGFLSPQQHSGRPIAPNLMEQLSQYFGNAMDLRNLDLSLFRAYNENLASCTALTVEFDPVCFLAKAVLRLSNNLLNLRYPSLEDGLLYTIIMSRIPKPILLIFLRSDLPSARSAHRALVELSSHEGDVQTFRFLAMANNGYLQQQLGSSICFIRAAARVKQCDILRSCLDSITASPKSLAALMSLLGEEEAPSVSVLVARTLIRLFDFKRCNIWDQLRARTYSGWKTVEMMRRWNHSAVTILLEAGFDVDNACPALPEYSSARLWGLQHLWRLQELYDLNDIPMPWHVSILDYEYYNSTAQYSTMQAYSLRLGTVFDRYGLSRAGREGARALSKYLSRWHANSGTHGLAQFLQLFFVEQLWLNKQEHDWLLINNLLDYGVDPSLPDLDGISFQGLFCGTIIRIASHGSTDAGRTILQRLIDGGAQLDALALLTAVSKEGIHGLEMVQSLGADLASFGPYALFRALKFNNTEAIDWLLERGVDPLHPMQDGIGSYFTVLGAAIKCDSEVPTSIDQNSHKILPCLVNSDENRAKDVEAVLSLACSRSRPLLRPDDTDPINFLIAIFQKLNGHYHPDKHRNNLRLLCREALQLPSSKVLQILEHIAVLQDWEFFEEIANQGQLTGPGNPLASLIFYKAPPALIRKMLRLTPDYNARTLRHDAIYDSDMSAFEAAARVWDAGLLRELVSTGSGIDRAVSDVWINGSLQLVCLFNTLSAAETQAQMETVQYLLELGAPIEGIEGQVKPRLRMSPLQMASSQGNLELVLLLLKHGADFNSTRALTTPLDCAAQHGRLDIVQVLLYVGAISYTTQYTPLDGAIDYALWGSHHEIAKLLCRYALSKGFQLSQEHSKLL